MASKQISIVNNKLTKTITIDRDLYLRLWRVSQLKGFPIDWVIERAIKFYLELICKDNEENC